MTKAEAALPSIYDPKPVESRQYAFWEERGYFDVDAHSPHTDSFCITVPPPNVTGSLHMGHALNHTVHDVLIRWNRMRGKLTLCIPGTDHAGIATQKKVEDQLHGEGLSRHEIGRESFLQRTRDWRAQYGGIILKQLRLLGCSYGWNRERFTMDEGYSKAVQRAFYEFYQRGWIYRGKRVINWCPRCRTALSDLEVEYIEQQTSLWYLRYPSQKGDRSVLVATTRPETMLGDTAIAVNPSDERYVDLVEQSFVLPLMNRVIPLIADEYVDPAFGTGAVKVTPAHDPNDFEIGQRHQLNRIVVIGEDGLMTAEAGPYQGMDRYECRKAVIRDLEAQSLLARTEDYLHSVGRCARCQTIIEPLLSEQWFVKMQEMASGAVEAIRSGRVRYVPDRFTAIALEWLDHIRDWCVSRQIWWGHRVPVWTCEDCSEILVSPGNETPRCAKCGSSSLQQDPDVLDTWFSSALWPFAVLGWPDKTEELRVFYPTNLLITARDILHLWVSRMIMTSLVFQNDIPFHEVYVHPTILNWEGKRMSKSLGTGIDPLELIEQYGSDATRFGLLFQCSLTQDLRFTEERIEMSRNFCNKIWNASRFVLSDLGDLPSEGTGPLEPALLPLPERWILSRLERTVAQVTDAVKAYNFDVAAKSLYEFIWSEFCDWYLELAKPILRQETGTEQRLTRQTLGFVLERTLRLLHPFMPFISEEIWQHLSPSDESLMVQSWPESNNDAIDEVAEMAMDQIIAIIRNIRFQRADLSIAPNEKVKVKGHVHSQTMMQRLESSIHEISFETLAGVESFTLIEDYSSGESETVEVEVIPATAEHTAKALEFLNKKLVKVERDLERVNNRLSNTEFLAKAKPEAIDNAEKEKAALEKSRSWTRTMIQKLQETL